MNTATPVRPDKKKADTVPVEVSGSLYQKESKIYVKDVKGRKQDLIVMRCDLEAAWREIEDYFAHRDWQRAR